MAVKKRTSTLDWEDVRYSVPTTALFDLVVVRATEYEVFIYRHDLSLLATHTRAPRGHREPVIDLAHRPRKLARHDIDALSARLGVGPICTGDPDQGRSSAKTSLVRAMRDPVSRRTLHESRTKEHQCQRSSKKTSKGNGRW